MTTLHAPDMYVIIGDEYAKRLGYEGLVGSMGIIDDVMNALCGVTILSGSQEMVGKQTDVHIQDCILQEYGKVNNYDVIVDLKIGNIFYSNNTELVEFTKDYLYRHDLRAFKNVSFMHEVLDFCEKELPHTAKIRNFDWVIHCLDDREDKVSRIILETYEAEKAQDEQEQEAFQEDDLKQQQAKLDLIAQLTKQMEAQSLQAKVDELFKQKSADTPSHTVTPYLPPSDFDLKLSTKEEEDDSDAEVEKGPFDDDDYANAR